MTRTKRPSKINLKRNVEKENIYQDLEKIANDSKKSIDVKHIAECKQLDLAFKVFIGSVGPDFLNKTIKQLKNELHLNENRGQNNRCLMLPPRSAARPTSHDDGYLTESDSVVSGASGSSSASSHKRLSRSVTRTAGAGSKPSTASKTVRSRRCSRSADPPQTTSKNRRLSRSVYRTPCYTGSKFGNNFPAITPKVTPNMPLTMLRRPRQGEMVMSMSGSPLLVSTVQSDERANCNIPLHDGTMLSLMPERLRQSQTFVPFGLMDQEVLLQLKTLRQNLDTVVRIGEENYKSK